MKALGKLKKEPGIWMFETDKPSPKADELLIKIKKTAICGTDVHIYNWDKWAQKNVPVPLTTGHEFMGEVVETGSAVRGVQVGDRVSGEGHVVCGCCRNCRGGREHLCPNTISVGVNRTGCFAEYLVIPARNACVLPDEVTDEVASILDPLGNAVHTALSFDLVGEDVLVTGAGPIGIMAAAVARHAGARRIVITDVNDYRLSLAARFGAVQTVNVQKQNLKKVCEDLGIDKEGFGVGLELSGNPQAFNSMLDHMSYGGRIAMLGFLPENTSIDWNQMIMKGLMLKGIYGREMFATWQKMIAMLQSGLDVSPVITHRFPVDEFEKGFEVMRSGEACKVVLDWG